MQPYHFYRPNAKTLHDFLELLVELGVKHTSDFNHKEKQKILELIASNKSGEKYDFSEALQEVLAKNLDKESDKRNAFFRLISEFVFYNGLLGYGNREEEAAKTSTKLIDYFFEELFSVFENRIQCDIYKIEEHNELLIEEAHYQCLSPPQRELYNIELRNEYGVNESNFY